MPRRLPDCVLPSLRARGRGPWGPIAPRPFCRCRCTCPRHRHLSWSSLTCGSRRWISADATKWYAPVPTEKAPRCAPPTTRRSDRRVSPARRPSLRSILKPSPLRSPRAQLKDVSAALPLTDMPHVKRVRRVAAADASPESLKVVLCPVGDSAAGAAASVLFGCSSAPKPIEAA